MGRVTLLATTIAFTLLLACGTAMAAVPYGTLDANTLDGPKTDWSSIVKDPRGQTFVPLGSGQLTGAQLGLRDYSSDPGDGVSVELWRLNASGEPETRLASATVSPADVPPGDSTDLLTVDFDHPPLVRAGERYAILASSQSEFVYGLDYHLNDSDPAADIYPDGGGLIKDDNGWQPYPQLDYIFAIYVNNRPVVEDPKPAGDAPLTANRPGISARVTDAETDLTESAVSLFVDGRSVGRRAFVYDSGTNRLFYKPRLRLEPGAHTVRVVAADERGLTGTERWQFKTR